MRYVKSLFFNFLTVFFANHILPGIDVVDMTKLPHVGGDLFFSFGLGLLNSLIFPVFRLLKRDASWIRIAATALILNFAAYALLKLFPFIGIHVETVEGYILSALVVSIGSFLTNFQEMKRHHHHHKPAEPSEHA